MKAGYKSVLRHIKRNGPHLIFLWLALVFLKTHLKDKSLRVHHDHRKAATKIGERYDWATIHHIHCLVRSVLTGARLDSSILGSFYMLYAKERPHFGQFDYADNYPAKSIMLRFKEIVFFTILNDACATYTLLKAGKLSKISGPLSPIQIREVFARITYTSLLVKHLPRFISLFGNGYYTITAEHSEFVEAEKHQPKLYGSLLLHACKDELDAMAGPDSKEAKKNAAEGRWTFLFNPEGSFIEDSMELIQPI